MKKYPLFFGIFMILIMVLGAGCVTTRPSSTPLITTSFYPLYYFTTQIVGNNTEVVNLTPAGVEPHDFEPTARDIARIEDSTLLILNGFGLESWGERVKGEVASNGTQVIEMASAVSTALSNEEGKGFDPHIWLDPVLAKEEVQLIDNAVSGSDPAHREVYKENTNRLLQKLTQLDTEYRQGLAQCSQNSFITSHSAFGYLAREYGLEQKSIAGLSPDAEPSSRQLADLTKFAKDNQVKYIFFESLVSPKLAETLAHEVGAETLVLNPLEGLTEEEMKEGKDYFSVMRENLKNLRIALECK
jgi:zinc transport system substrate-binding protein